MTNWYVYIIKTRNNTLYTGATNNLERRFSEHVAQGSKTAKYLMGKAPLELVYYEVLNSKSEALSREYQIKLLSRKEKILLINNGIS